MGKNGFRFAQGVRAIATIVRICDAQHNGANTASVVRYFSRRRRGDLHSIEMATIGQAVYIFGELRVDSHFDERCFNLCGAVGRYAIETRRHGIPVAAKVGMHEFGLIGQPAQRIAENRRPLTRLHDAQLICLSSRPVLCCWCVGAVPMKIALATRLVAE